MRNPKVFGVCVCGLLGGCSDLLGSDTQEVADPAPRLTVTARFHDAIGGTNLRLCGGAGQPACTSGPPVQVRWGVPFSPTDPQSGLGFAPSPTMPLTYDAAFTAGPITLINFPTDSGTASGGGLLDLHLPLAPSGGGATLLDGTATVPIRIDETPNTPPCAYPSVTPCADKV